MPNITITKTTEGNATVDFNFVTDMEAVALLLAAYVDTALQCKCTKALIINAVTTSLEEQ